MSIWMVGPVPGGALSLVRKSISHLHTLTRTPPPTPRAFLALAPQLSELDFGGDAVEEAIGG